jgi:hypothetical protein
MLPLSAVECGPRKALRAVALRTTTRRLPLPASTAPFRPVPVPTPEPPPAPPPEPTPDDDEYWFGDDAVATLSGKPSAGGGSSGGQGAPSSVLQLVPGGNAKGKPRWGSVTVRDGGGWSHVAHSWKDLDVAATLRELPELEGASDEELCAMAAHSKLLTLPRYGKLWRKSTPMLSCFVLLRGQLRSPASRGVEGRLGPTGCMLCGGAWLEHTLHLDCPVAERASVLLCVNAAEAKADPLLERICVHLREALGDTWKVELLKVWRPDWGEADGHTPDPRPQTPDPDPKAQLQHQPQPEP